MQHLPTLRLIKQILPRDLKGQSNLYRALHLAVAEGCRPTQPLLCLIFTCAPGIEPETYLLGLFTLAAMRGKFCWQQWLNSWAAAPTDSWLVGLLIVSGTDSSSIWIAPFTFPVSVCCDVQVDTA